MTQICTVHNSPNMSVLNKQCRNMINKKQFSWRFYGQRTNTQPIISMFILQLMICKIIIKGGDFLNN